MQNEIRCGISCLALRCLAIIMVICPQEHISHWRQQRNMHVTIEPSKYLHTAYILLHACVCTKSLVHTAYSIQDWSKARASVFTIASNGWAEVVFESIDILETLTLRSARSNQAWVETAGRWRCSQATHFSGGSRIWWRRVLLKYCMQSACENFCDCAHFRLNHAHFKSFWRESPCFTCQFSCFWSRFLPRHANVGHRSSFLCSPARDRRRIPCSLLPLLLSTRFSQKGGSMAPWDPPLDLPLDFSWSSHSCHYSYL